MQIKHKWAVLLAALLATGLLLSGAALAANNPESKATPKPSQTDMLDQAVKDGKITAGEADVIRQLRTLRRERLTQLRTDSEALIEKAVKDGKLTREQADRMLHHGRQGAKPGVRPMEPRNPGDRQPPQGLRDGKAPKSGAPGAMRNLTREQLQNKLDQAVKDGRLTPEQAKQRLDQWEKAHSRQP